MRFFLHFPQVREKLYRAFTTRASSTSVGEEGKSLDNEPHIARILELKKTMAGLLGYDSYAEVSLASKVRARGFVCASLIFVPSNSSLSQRNVVKSGPLCVPPPHVDSPREQSKGVPAAVAAGQSWGMYRFLSCRCL